MPSPPPCPIHSPPHPTPLQLQPQHTHHPHSSLRRSFDMNYEKKERKQQPRVGEEVERGWNKCSNLDWALATDGGDLGGALGLEVGLLLLSGKDKLRGWKHSEIETRALRFRMGTRNEFAEVLLFPTCWFLKSNFKQHQIVLYQQLFSE